MFRVFISASTYRSHSGTDVESTSSALSKMDRALFVTCYYTINNPNDTIDSTCCIPSVPSPMQHSASSCSCLSDSAEHSPRTPFVFDLDIHEALRDLQISELEPEHRALVVQKLLARVVRQIFVL